MYFENDIKGKQTIYKEVVPGVPQRYFSYGAEDGNLKILIFYIPTSYGFKKLLNFVIL